MTGKEYVKSLVDAAKLMGHEASFRTIEDDAGLISGCQLVCSACDFRIDATGYFAIHADTIESLGKCWRPLGATNWFEFRRPSVRELLEKRP